MEREVHILGSGSGKKSSSGREGFIALLFILSPFLMESHINLTTVLLLCFLHEGRVCDACGTALLLVLQGASMRQGRMVRGLVTLHGCDWSPGGKLDRRRDGNAISYTRVAKQCNK